MHKNIKAFSIEGEISDDKYFYRLRSQYESLIITDMRNKGYVPVLDIGPFFSTFWNGKTYDFINTVHGVFIGKAKSWEFEGWTNGMLIVKNTVKNK